MSAEDRRVRAPSVTEAGRERRAWSWTGKKEYRSQSSWRPGDHGSRVDGAMYLGIEIGGTKLQLGIGPGDGRLVALERARVDPWDGAEGIRNQIVALVPKLLHDAGFSRSDILAVGMGFGGPVDSQTGTVIKSHQVGGWEGFQLADWSRRELGWPTTVHNDADTAGLAEARFGAGQGHSPLFYITVGSGIGGGFIIDDRIYRGAGVGASEIGHLRWPEPLPSLKNHANSSRESRPLPVEELASGWAIAQRVRNLLAHPELTNAEHHEDREALLRMVGSDLDQLSTEQIGDAARRGNRLARYSIDMACRVLGWAVASVIALVCPRRVVIGGGVSMLGNDLFLEPLRHEVSRYCFGPFAQCYDIVPASLGESVVVHGALELARAAYVKH